MGGGKREKNFFQKHTYIASFNDGKNRLEKVRKHVFYKHMNIVKKNGGKRGKKFFQETHSIRKQTTMEKNRLEKVRKHVFYKHTNIVTKKWGGKNAKKNSQKTHE